jgi:hypothetical protein
VWFYNRTGSSVLLPVRSSTPVSIKEMIEQSEAIGD